MADRFKALAFDLNKASLTALRAALPGWLVEEFVGATSTSLPLGWNPGEVDLLVVDAELAQARKLELCRVLARRGVFTQTTGQESTATAALGPRGSLQSRAQRAHAPLLVLVPPGCQELVDAALAAGAHSCLTLPLNAKEVARMLVHARGGNQPGRHTEKLEGAQGEDYWRDDGGQG